GQVSNLPTEYLERAKKDAAITDLMYSNNDVRKEIYETYYWYSGPVLKCSVPRNTVLFHVTDELREKVYGYFGLTKTKKLLIYAPTFRKSGNTDLYRMDFERVLRAAEDRWGGEFACLLRLHPNDAKQSNFITYNETLLNASNYPDMQELLAVSEVLITDYSGCMFDFSFMKKPVFLYVPDLNEYLRKERELQFSFDEIPFQRAVGFEELLQDISCFVSEEYCRKCEAFFEKIGLSEDGSGAKVIGDIIIEKCM
ncbi:MAG: CDP-glycerol glycerophosphotransferase family protein, partial [Lachnospiraceae bacterium]|nr:CDP-glycerol glycerophosphotransferase family protein [Lachnospiraceae bacterium]